jgi:hypothetical protein
VLERPEIDTLLRGKWNAMRSCLVLGDTEGALAHFSLTAREEYRRVFTIIGADLPAMAAGMGDIALVCIRERTAKYRIAKGGAGGGSETLSCYIYFVRDAYGHWHIHSF